MHEVVALGFPPSSEDVLVELERDCLETAREAIRKPRLYPSLTGTTRQIANDYRNRALFELVQNAHDALGDDGQDEIRISYRRTEHGAVLSVANRGVGFNTDNVEGVRLPSQSTKRYGEGIGNKGLGLRSLASLTNVPEIYSCLGEGRPREAFDGYCFRFASDEQARDISVEVGAGDDQIEWLLKNVPRSMLTVPLRHQPPDVRALAQAGFATVVRVVLTGEGTMADVEAQIAEFTQSEAPPTLFLDRIGILSVEVEGSKVRAARITRRSSLLVGAEGSVPFSLYRTRVDGSDYLVVRRRLRRDAFECAVRASVGHDPKLEEWLDAPSDTLVSLAVPLGSGEAVAGRTYCYLPLGRGVASPFLGHMDAPFLASLNRKELDLKTPLNAFLYEACAGAALAAARYLAAGAWERLDVDRRAVADLMTWSPGFVRHLSAANGGRPPSEDAFLPVAGSGWTSFRSARRWDAVKDGLSARTLAIDAGAPILDGRLGASRLDRIAETRGAMWLPADIKPDAVEAAAWVETLAAVKASQRDPWKAWGRFVDAVARSFAEKGLDVSELAGKEFLFGGPTESKPSLMATQSSVDDPVYLAERSAGRVKRREARMPPRSLGRRVNFLDGRIALASATREAFLKAKLVSEVDPLRILRDHRRIVSANAKPETLAGILAWAYDVWEALGDEAAKAVRESRLRVPTRSGKWIEAADAVFSGAWTDEGRRLESVARELAEISLDARHVEASFLADPGAGPIPGDEQGKSEWTRFLVACGVRDGMRTVPAKAGIKGLAHRFWRSFLEGRDASGPKDPAWVARVSDTRFLFPQSPYVGKDAANLGFCRLPFQGEHGSLSQEGKLNFALLVLGMLRDMRKGYLTVKVAHEYKGDPHDLPSPARVFLDSGDWFPVADGSGVRYVAPSSVWWRGTRGREIPRAVVRPHQEIRSRLVEEKVWLRVSELGLNDWGSPATGLQRLSAMADACGTASGNEEKASLRGAIASAWQDMVASDAALPAGARFPVCSGDAFSVVQAGAAAERVYVTTDASGMEARILQERGACIVEGVSSPAEVVKLFAASGASAVALSGVEVAMYADGERFVPSTADPRLVGEDRGWLTDLATLALDVEGRMLAFQVSRPAFRAAIEKVRVHRCEVLSVVVDGGEPSLIKDRFVHLADRENPTLVAVGRQEIGWDDMGQLARALERLVDGRADGALRVAFSYVANAFAGTEFEKPPNDAIALALRWPLWRVEQAFGREGGDVEHIKTVVAPVVWALTGADIGRSLVSVLEQSDGDFDLEAWLGAGPHPDLPNGFATWCRDAEDRDWLRRKAGIPLAEYNVAVRMLGQQPLESRSDVRGQFEFHRRAVRDEVVERLRRHHRQDFTKEASLARYVEARAMPFLKFDESWPYEREEIDGALVRALAKAALDALYGVAVPELDLPAFGELHKGNEILLSQTVRKVSPLVVAWCQKNSVSIPEIWKLAPIDVVRHMDAGGLLDFVALEGECLWLAFDLAEIWPKGMPHSLDTSILKLADGQVEDANTWKADEARRREEDRRRFTFAGKDYDGGSRADLASMVQEARLQVAADAGWEGRCGKGNLVPPHAPSRRPGGGGEGGGRGNVSLVVAERRMSDAKKTAVGLLGEVRAFEWIMRRHGLTREQAETAWVSPNRSVAHVGDKGSDTRGFDFEIVTEKGVKWRYEVKASQYDPGEFDMGSSEVKAALEAASDRNVKYRVLYVPEVATPGRWRVVELPNPLSPTKRGLFKELERSAIGFGFEEGL